MDQAFTPAPFRANYVGGSTSGGSAAATQSGKKKPFWTSLISELAGGVGLAAGAALAPETGGLSLLIPAAGAALGSFTGRLAENKVRDNRNPWDTSSLKQAAVEGGINGVTAGALEGLSGTRAALKSGTPLIDAILNKGGSSVADAAVSGVSDAAARSGTERVGEGMLGKQWGIKGGIKMAGDAITPQEAGQLQDFVINRIGVPATATADQVMEHASNFQKVTGKAIGDVVANNDRRVTATEAKSLVNDALTQIGKVGGATTDNSTIKTLLSQIKNARSVQELQDLYTSSAKLINFNANPDAATANVQTVAKAIRGEVGDFLDNAVAGRSALNQDYSMASRVLDATAAATKNPASKGVKVPLFGNVGGGVTGSIKSAVGQGLVKADASATGGGVVSKLTDALSLAHDARFSRGLTTKPFVNALAPPAPSPDGTSAAPTSSSPLQDAIMNTPPSTAGGADAQSSGQFTGLTPQDLQDAINNDYATTGGKRISQILDIYKALSSDTLNSATGGVKLSAAQQLRHDNIQSALASLDTAGVSLENSGGAQGIKGELGKVPYLGKFIDPQAAAYTNTKIELATALAKAVTGSAKPGQDTIDKYMHSLPDINDPSDYAQNKLKKLQLELLTQAKAFNYADILQSYN